MAASVFLPDVKVEIAFDSGYATPAASRTWTDVSAYVEAAHPITISRGRSDELAQVQPSKLAVVLDNRDGRFTPKNTAGAYYPNVKKGRPIRVTAKWPLDTGTDDPRFTGYIDEWPVTWPDGTDAASTVTVTASSRTARLSRGSGLKSVIEHEILADSPAMYYPLGEPAGATSAGNQSATRQNPLTVTQKGAGGTLAFGGGTGPGTDSLTAPVLTPASAASGKYLSATTRGDLAPDGTTEVALECWFVCPTATGSVQTLINLGTTTGLADLSPWLEVNESGRLEALVGSTVANAVVTSAATVTDGATHHAVLRLRASSATQVTATLWLDGAQVGTSGAVAWDTAGGIPVFPDYNRLRVGGISTADTMYGGTIAHVAVHIAAGTTDQLTTARIVEHHRAGSDGFAGDTSGERVLRLARYAGTDPADIDAEPGMTASMAFQDTTGKTDLTLMTDVAQTEGGILFDGKDGRLVFHGRDHRYGSASVLALDATTQEVEAGLDPRLDDQGLVNDVTANRDGGAVTRVVAAGSVADYGTYAETLTLLTTSDDEVVDAANMRVNTYAEPLVRIPNVGSQLVTLTSGQLTATLTADLGDRVTLTGLPAQAPAASMGFFVEGYTEVVGHESWLWTANLSPADLSGVWQLDSATYSLLGTSTRLGY